jgi:hypothetical protein
MMEQLGKSGYAIGETARNAEQKDMTSLSRSLLINIFLVFPISNRFLLSNAVVSAAASYFPSCAHQ